VKSHVIHVSTRAHLDLREIWLDIADYSPSVADDFLDRIWERIETLSIFPERGIPRPDLAANARIVIVGKYLIMFDVNEYNVTIKRVIHGAMDLRKLT
jgi:toxin ParE1/3/4